jgi:hypothetical protein
VNAAFLLVTSAMLVGQGGDKKVPPPPPPIVAPAPAAVASGCCSQDPCGCEGFGHRLRDRMRGLFNRDNCDSCQPTVTHTHHARVSNNCDSCQPRIFNWQPRGHTHNACAPATCNDSCGNGHGGLFERLRHNFRRSDSCCDGGCGSVTGAVVPPPDGKVSEPINPPKKMPVDPKVDPKTTPKVVDPKVTPPKVEPKKTGSVSIGTPIDAANPGIISVAPAIPSVEITPIPNPRIEGERRDPF